MGVIKPFHKPFEIRGLRPYRAGGNVLPAVRGKEESITAIDPDLTPEEEVYVRHYLIYADILLNRAAEEEALASGADRTKPRNVLEMRRRNDVSSKPDETA